jgi:dolichol-phosphate mannosyltransferase
MEQRTRQDSLTLSPPLATNPIAGPPLAIASRSFERPLTNDIAGTAELTIVVPTLNEKENVAPLLESLEAALGGIRWEIIFVDDDSADGTADEIRSIARRDARVRCLQRIGRRGLATACIEGVLASAALYVAVMDADLQHDERILPKMLDAVKYEARDLAIGSRYVDGGGVGDWNRTRAGISSLATSLSRVICKAEIGDPMSGFFMVRRSIFEGAVRNLSGQGFKILLDLVASAPQPPRIREIPYQFRPRHKGASKLDALVAWEFGMLLLDKLLGQVIPVRLVLFALVGSVGLVVHLSTLWTTLKVLTLGFTASQTIATVAAMNFNFVLNNILTYRDKRLRGARLVRGLFSFYLICSIGAVANIAIASLAFSIYKIWWFAGISGALIGALWNYSISSMVTWRST